MNTLIHKKFIGSFNYVEEDDVLYGKIEGITDLVTFEGRSIEEVKNAFIEAVEDYLYICKEIGKDPLKSFKGAFNVRVSSDLHREASMTAIKRNLNLNQFVQKAIEHELKRENNDRCC